MSDKRWGAGFATVKGYITYACETTGGHTFGGNKWLVEGDSISSEPPLLMLNLDLTDHRLSHIPSGGLRQLPLCSYINDSTWVGRQDFRIIEEKNLVELIYREINQPEVYNDPNSEFAFPNPLPETNLCLREMYPEEYPTDYDLYSRAMEQFLGSPDLLRISGPPLYMDNAVVEYCTLCNSEMLYVASIGCEHNTRNLLKDRPFFYGEAALYFFFCSPCALTRTISQG